MQNTLCWTELSKKKIIGPDLIQETKEKLKMIRERLKVSTDRQKSYADTKINRCDLIEHILRDFELFASGNLNLLGIFIYMSLFMDPYR